MMKNFIITVLIVLVGVLGYALFSRSSSPPGKNTAPPSTAANQQQSQNEDNTLDLSGKSLRQVDKNLLDNSSLVTLNVSNNNLTGALPAEIRKLTNLEVLRASNNQMTGIPAEIGQLSKLREADFSNNQITGLPLEIGNLKKLETLDLRGNPNVSSHDLGLIKAKIPNATILID